MEQYGYTLKKNSGEPKRSGRFRKEELELMTTFQLREICRREKIIQGVLDPMDKEELVRVILRYRGAEEYFLIQTEEEEGLKAVSRVFRTVRMQERQGSGLEGGSKIVVYEGIATGPFDGLTLPYNKDLAGTNAFVVGGDRTVCGIFHLVPKGGDMDCLYLTRAAGLSCRESGVKHYSLYCMGRRESERMYELYQGKTDVMPGQMEVWRIPILDFQVRKPVKLSLPLAIDFGTCNTTAGVYLDDQYFEEAGLCKGEKGLKAGQVNYALFYDPLSDWQESALFPSVAGVRDLEGEEGKFLFGYDAIRLAQSSYIDEGFCVFYDIKRWIGDYEKTEEVTDRQGRRGVVSRKEILKAYFDHVIKAVRDRFKCDVTEVHISCPVKQKSQFGRLFRELLPEYAVEEKDMIDEGVSVLYNTIWEMNQKGSIEDGQVYKALLMDCGGGTTDLCSCRFRVWNKRVSYRIEIDMAYENGDTDFGGNNLTYRIMQLLKTAIASRLYDTDLAGVDEILAAYDMDVFRYVDRYGAKGLYEGLEAEYEKAEAWIPTRFREFENQSRLDYYKVKNNFYFLFQLAEVVKKVFYNHVGTLRAALSSEPVTESDTIWIPVDKWKLSGRKKGDRKLRTVKDFPVVYVNIYQLELLLKGDIYGLVRRFMEPMYEEDTLEDYSLIKLTGQSCKIGMFRDALKEFVPGRTIQFKRRSGDLTRDLELKMTCVDGALKYLKDKKYGFADVTVTNEVPALPYRVTAYTHNGEKVVLIHRLRRDEESGMISRNMEDLTLKLYLEDLDGQERYQYVCHSSTEDFEEKLYEDIRQMYGNHIRQADTDDIVEREVKFFVWTRPEEWAFLVVPVFRREGRLYVGKEKMFYFENEGWMRNFFDGMK